MSNLGQLLAQNIAQEKQAALDHAAGLNQVRTEKELKARLIAKAFFDGARDYFTSGIEQRKPVNTLFLQVGGRRYGVDCHDEFAFVLEGFRVSNPTLGPLSLQDPNRFGPLWADFQAWATGQALVAKWDSCWDSGGTTSWWELRVAPAAC